MRRPFSRYAGALVALLTLTVLAHGGVAHAAGEERSFVSSDSVLLGGAARSVITDGGAAWLNPARLTQVERMSVMANINAFRLNHERIPSAVNIQGGAGIDLGQTNVSVLPGSMSLAGVVNDRLVIAAGVFVTKAEVHAESILVRLDIGNELAEMALSVDGRDQDYNAVLALGWRANARSSYGLSVVLQYGRETYNFARWNHYRSEALEELSGTTLLQQLTRAGLGVIVGGSWELGERFTLSAVIQPPTLMIVDSERSLMVDARAGQDAETWLSFESTPVRRLSADARPMGSMRMHLGGAVELDPLLLSGEVEVRVEPKVSGRGYEGVVNARLGMQGRVNPRVLIGGGVFTNLTQRPEVDEFYFKNLQQIGTSAGVRITRTIRLHAEERARTIERSTVFGARYMLGLGQFSGATIDYETRETHPRAVRYLAHELSLYLGAEFIF